ncbi:MAG: 2-dehydro-3-deoxyglucarate aldolase [Candidatus Eremiobacteraeota bacterium]|nr:2-dehydro-3-deoxyglucarate aldolase [Candidatus Eremiobacteraeota bacterium]
MKGNAVKAKLRAGGISVGSWLAFESPLSAEIMAAGGFDWLMIDTEHGPITGSATIGLVNACRAAGVVPFLRVIWNESSLIQQALDMGAFGVLVPVVNARAHAEAAAADAKYPPVGNRSCGGSRAPIAFGTDMATYMPRANDETLLMVQIETLEAVEAADDIASVDGVDLLFVGPNDLSLSMSEWPLVWSKAGPKYKEAIARIPQIAKKHGKHAGIQIHDPAFGNDCIAMGYTMIGYSGDSGMLARAAKAARAEIRA